MSKMYYFYANPKIPDSIRVARKYASYLREGGALFGPEWLCSRIRGMTPCDTILPGTVCALAFGGDGTLLRLAPMAARYGTPVLGVHAGHVGFLMQANERRAEKICRYLLDSDYILIKRSMMHIDCPSGEYLALNDISILRAEHPGIMEVQVDWDGETVFSPHGDGVILSTTLGSTAYNMAAGGPIVHPSAETFILTPVCAREQLSRPTVLPFRGELTFTLPSLHRDTAQLSIDGQTLLPMGGEDKVTVRPADEKLVMVQMESFSFFNTLRQKTALWNGL